MGLAIVGLFIIWKTHQIWAAAFLGVLFALGLNGPAEWLRRRVRKPTWLSTLLVAPVILTGRGMEGTMLLAVCVILALAFYHLPEESGENVGGILTSVPTQH